MRRILLVGCGAIGSRFVELTPAALEVVINDMDTVGRENLGISTFFATDVGQSKALAATAHRRAKGGRAVALHGELAYRVRPGLLRTVDAVVVALDNPAAIRDVATAIREADVRCPVLVLTCGGAEGGYQVRVFESHRRCPCCSFGVTENRADQAGTGTSCADHSAPRAAAHAAQAAAEAGMRVLDAWTAGDRSLANTRLQCDPAGTEYVVRLPAEPAASCPVGHGTRDDETILNIDRGIANVSLSEIARLGTESLGDDARLDLGRRATPQAGAYCAECGSLAETPSLLLPAALEAARPSCSCEAALLPMGTRSRLDATEWLAPQLADLPLSAAGAGPGDEFVFENDRGRVRVRLRLDSDDLPLPETPSVSGDPQP